jgi:GntR family transcriptional regulator
VLESIETLAQRSGLAVAFGALNVERRPASREECDALGLQPDDPVISVTRAILADERSVAYLVDTLPLGLIDAEELNEGFRGSILDLLLRRGAPPLTASSTQINAVPASSAVARVLGIQRGDVLLCFTADLYSTDGRVVDHSMSYFLPGYFRFHVVRRVGQA